MDEMMVNEVKENVENVAAETVQSGSTGSYAPAAFGVALVLAAIAGIVYIKKRHDAKKSSETTDEDKVVEMFEEPDEIDET